MCQRPIAPDGAAVPVLRSCFLLPWEVLQVDINIKLQWLTQFNHKNSLHHWSKGLPVCAWLGCNHRTVICWDIGSLPLYLCSCHTVPQQVPDGFQQLPSLRALATCCCYWSQLQTMLLCEVFQPSNFLPFSPTWHLVSCASGAGWCPWALVLLPLAN